MKIIRPLQLSLTRQVLEQNRKFYFTASISLGFDLNTGESLLDLDYLKNIFQCMGDNPLPDPGMPKPNGEFLVSGAFFFFFRQPVTGGEVRVNLGRKEKSLYVFGKRKWEAGMPSDPEKITTVPLEYAKAFGGQGYEKNPEGMGFNDGLLPCVEDPKTLVTSKKDKPSPAGFAPLHPLLPQRMKYQGTYATDYKTKYFPGYPADHDWRFFLCAPTDQWSDNFYQGNEHFALYHMHPELPEIKGQLPGFYARCFLNLQNETDENLQELPLHLDTVWFFPEKLTGLLIFRGTMEAGDDEASEVKDILCAYEDQSIGQRPMEHYKEAFEKRKRGNDPLMITLNTRDLIPDDHKSPMEILMGKTQKTDTDSPFGRNMEAKARSIQTLADEKIEEAVIDAEKRLEKIDMPDDARVQIPKDASPYIPGKNGGLDIRTQIQDGSEKTPDPDVEKFNSKLEEALPGITGEADQKLDLTNFSFEKIEEAMEAVDQLVEKKTNGISEVVQRETNKAKEQLKRQAGKIEEQINRAESQDQADYLEKAKENIQESIAEIEDLDTAEPSSKTPLPRVKSDEITDLLKNSRTQFDPMVINAMQHVQSVKKMGIEDEKTQEMEKQIRENLNEVEKDFENSMDQSKASLKELEEGFKETYALSAHFMQDGLPPHKNSLEEVKDQFFKTFFDNCDVSGKDWACIDLSGENLDGINLSGAFLEQVNFKSASLRGADLSGAIMARANLEQADLTEANLRETNIGAVKAKGAIFADADLTLAKLSKGDFTGADFSKAILEKIETFEVILENTIFIQAYIPSVTFLEIDLTKSDFTSANLNTSAFIRCNIQESNFSNSILSRTAFVDTTLKQCSFHKCNLSNGCFVITDPEKSTTENLVFTEAVLRQANFQNMAMRRFELREAILENAFFEGADLSNADLRGAQARNTQFRKTNLTAAVLDNMNLDQGSLSKANLSRASFKGANLYAVDFLRANITETDFSSANLDATLLEHWRPK